MRPTPHASDHRYGSAIACTDVIRSIDSRVSTFGSGSARNDAHRQRSPTVDHNCPAAAMPPVRSTIIGSRRTTSLYGSTEYATAFGDRGEKLVLESPRGARICRSTE